MNIKDKPKFKFVPKKNCKMCYGRGSVVRTLPMGNKRFKGKLFRCGCVKKVEVEAVDN